MRYKWFTAGVLMLALALVGGAIIYTSLEGITRIDADGRVHQGLGRRDQAMAEADEEKQLDVSGPATLDIDNASGSVTIEAANGSEVVVSIHKQAWAATQAEAEVHLSAISVEATQDGDAITIKVDTPRQQDDREALVEFTIKVPLETAVNVRTNLGDVKLSGTRGDVDVFTQFGNVDVSDVSGGVKAETTSGAIMVRRVQAGTAALDLRSNFGLITIEDSGSGRVDAHSNSGGISAIDLQADGAINLTSGFGTIAFENGRATQLDFESRSGDMQLRNLHVDGAVTLTSNFGHLTLDAVTSAAYALDTRSGTITVRGALGSGPHTMNTRFGNVQLLLPAASALSVDLETRFGTIASDLPITLEGKLDAKHWRGSINGGGTRLTATTSSGDISIQVLDH